MPLLQPAHFPLISRNIVCPAEHQAVPPEERRSKKKASSPLVGPSECSALTSCAQLNPYAEIGCEALCFSSQRAKDDWLSVDFLPKSNPSTLKSSSSAGQ